MQSTMGLILSIGTQLTNNINVIKHIYLFDDYNFNFISSYLISKVKIDKNNSNVLILCLE